MSRSFDYWPSSLSTRRNMIVPPSSVAKKYLISRSKTYLNSKYILMPPEFQSLQDEVDAPPPVEHQDVDIVIITLTHSTTQDANQTQAYQSYPPENFVSVDAPPDPPEKSQINGVTLVGDGNSSSAQILTVTDTQVTGIPRLRQDGDATGNEDDDEDND
ncbi:hypothetical protein K435DRAFT_808443 [Dendrothele bispora CBS 962.96]|uniref:Uncharacterized protein n=1 Tax=Dendrothele bispora (strain CBS 962.96) TaxID=1314807 RepID=A0A4S8L1F6_DENBC|nr:hypothetical protein K435DRAFT_808443 [Dendrothele bispora CBS 962.96]